MVMCPAKRNTHVDGPPSTKSGHPRGASYTQREMGQRLPAGLDHFWERGQCVCLPPRPREKIIRSPGYEVTEDPAWATALLPLVHSSSFLPTRLRASCPGNPLRRAHGGKEAAGVARAQLSWSHADAVCSQQVRVTQNRRGSSEPFPRIPEPQGIDSLHLITVATGCVSVHGHPGTAQKFLSLSLSHTHTHTDREHRECCYPDPHPLTQAGKNIHIRI